MTSCQDVLQISRQPERERIDVELKQSQILRSAEGQGKLAAEIVAFANRRGGRVFLGIRNDGTFEGKGIFDLDKDKGIIDSICHTHISPPVEYETQMLNCVDGDVLVVKVPARTEVPHALIGKRDGPEIKARIYYVRTAHGKRLVTDRQLEWLFKHKEDPDFDYRFPIVLNYFRDSLQLPIFDLLEVADPEYTFLYGRLLSVLPQDYLSQMSQDLSRVHKFLSELMPYVMLGFLSEIFVHSWLVRIEVSRNIESRTSLTPRSGMTIIPVEQFPKPKQQGVLATLSDGFTDILRNAGFRDLCVPAGAYLHIGDNSDLYIAHSKFNLAVALSRANTGTGPARSSPLHSLLVGEGVPTVGQLQSQPLDHFESDVKFSGRFRFPEEDVEEFQEYYNYALTIRDQLQRKWNYDEVTKLLPHPKIYVMNAKLDEILRLLRGK